MPSGKEKATQMSFHPDLLLTFILCEHSASPLIPPEIQEVILILEDFKNEVFILKSLELKFIPSDF